jgi:hypothetical protein
MDDMDLPRLKYIIKRFSQLLIIIMNQTTECLFPIFDSPVVLPGLLSDLLPVWIGCNPG